MPGFGELAFSMQMRDTIARMVREQIDEERPRYRYATVQTIDREAMKCGIVYNGETGVVKVNMGSIQPAEVGQIVRVEGIGTDKFITDVIGPIGAYLFEKPPPTPPTPPASSGLRANRPTDPPVGWEYFETDSRWVVRWDGTGWWKVGGPSASVGIGTTDAQVTITNTGANALTLAVGVNLPAGGTFRISYTSMTNQNDNSAGYMRLYPPTGTHVFERRYHNNNTGHGIWKPISFSAEMTLPQGSHTFGVYFAADPGGGWFYFVNARAHCWM